MPSSPFNCLLPLAGVLLLEMQGLSQATPLLPGDILISSAPGLNGGTVREYTTNGLLVQTFVVPPGSDLTPIPRDIAVDSLGRINIWNGTFTPTLTTLTPGLVPGNATSVDHTIAGWSTINNTAYGGLAVSGNYAYATDMFTFNGGEPNGIIRFDLTTFQAIRFGQGTANSHGDNIDLNIGLNGLLYAMYPGGSPSGGMIDVFDPQTMTLLRTINLNRDLGAVAVDQSGNIFVTSPFNASIFRFDPNGVQTGSLFLSSGGLYDLDLSSDGRLLTVSGNGDVILTDTSLSGMTSFNVGSTTTRFAAFVGMPVPEPRGDVLIIIGAGTALFGWRRRLYGR